MFSRHPPQIFSKRGIQHIIPLRQARQPVAPSPLLLLSEAQRTRNHSGISFSIAFQHTDLILSMRRRIRGFGWACNLAGGGHTQRGGMGDSSLEGGQRPHLVYHFPPELFNAGRDNFTRRHKLLQFGVQGVHLLRALTPRAWCSSTPLNTLYHR